MAPAPGLVLGVVKVGGSLVSDGARLRRTLAGLAEGRDGPAVVVPGGGPFAEAVRTAQGALGFGDALAHRLALDAMGRMAEVFSDLESRLRIVRDVDAIRAALADGHAALWNPADLRAGHPDIPESWDVTSDSLALWLAARLGAARCILLKSAPCPAGARPDALARLGLVDRAFPSFAKGFAGEIVLRGPDDEATVVGDGPIHQPSHPRPHPEVRGAPEPRRSPPGGAAIPGGLLRGRSAAPQDKGVGGRGERRRAGDGTP